MIWKSSWLALLCWLLTAPTLWAQTSLGVVASGTGTNPVMLAPIDGSDPARPALAAGGAAVTTGLLKGDFAFDFVQPIFPGRSVRLAAPVPAGGAVLGDTSHLDYDFCFSPKVSLGYQLADTNFGVQASGQILQLTGGITQVANVAPGPVNGTASAQGTVTVASANFIEGFLTFESADLEFLDHSCFKDMIFTTTLGGRLIHVDQKYIANILIGTAQSNLSASQAYNGYGVTGSLGSLYPCTERLGLYSTMRGSLLIGPNKRESSVTLNSGTPNSTAAFASEDKTTLIPVGEFEVGLIYGVPLTRLGPPPNRAPLLWCKTGFTGSVWGDLGLLRINEVGGSQFKDSNLYLVGFTIQIGLDY